MENIAASIWQSPHPVRSLLSCSEVTYFYYKFDVDDSDALHHPSIATSEQTLMEIIEIVVVVVVALVPAMLQFGHC